MSDKLKKAALFVIFFLSALISIAQKSKKRDLENKFRAVHWNLEDGLSSSISYDILKDRTGFLWISTEHGLNRFDGNTFKNYYHDPKNKGTIPDNRVSKLIEDSLHNIWIGTDRGLCRYDINADTFSTFRAAFPFWATKNELFCFLNDSIITLNVHSFAIKVLGKLLPEEILHYGLGDFYTIYNAETNSIWLLRTNQQKKEDGLLEISLVNGERHFFTWPCYRNILNHNHWSEAMKYDKKRNAIWINSPDGLVEFTLADKTFHHIPAMDQYTEFKDYNRFVGIDIDIDGRIWFATRPRGIMIYDPDNQSIKPLFEKNPTLQWDIGDANAGIYCDRDGVTWSNFWLRKGIYQLLPFDPVVTHYIGDPKQPYSLSSNTIFGVIPAGHGKLWVGSTNGLNIFDLQTQKVEVVLHSKDLMGQKNNETIFPLQIDTAKQEAWIYREGIIKMDMGTKKFSPLIFKDPNDRVIPGLNEGIFRVLKEGYCITASYNGTQAIFTMKSSDTAARQVLSFPDATFNQFKTFATNEYIFLNGLIDSIGNQTYKKSNDKWILTHTVADSIQWSDMNYDEKDGSYWIAGENQLFHVNKDFHIIRVYAHQHGLPELEIVGIVPDNKGNIWFHTDRSINQLNITTGQVISLSEKDGFEKQDFELIAFPGKDVNGTIYYGGGIFGEGFNKIIPDKFISPPSSVYFQILKINQKPFFLPTGVNRVDKLDLKYFQNKIAIETGIIDYYAKGKSRIRYKLEEDGTIADWQYAPYYYTIRYEGLRPGHYRLVVQASNASNEFNGPEKILFIHISEPFWNTWWFRIIAIVLIIGLLYLIIQYRSRNLRKHNILLEEKVMNRTRELKHSLEDLRQTQKQLIQSEKMASLGELTAGIAHEIQNPLNFVNNFSEVNKELIGEMNEEIEKGNYQEVKTIAKDIEENEEKINHHGKRADAIVKGMLQHSRSSNGQKESTDINALADEYLRLSYHGLRAKDKSFNATMRTDFDTTIGKIDVVSQDMGRVLLNLFTNAFYAVTEKKNALADHQYDPTVSVSTKKMYNKIEIRIKDNGNGIPPKALDKIFQPFFTTKPTGQGTGLGLSLSYDIVKAHGGEINVQTKAGEGAEFTITL